MPDKQQKMPYIEHAAFLKKTQPKPPKGHKLKPFLCSAFYISLLTKVTSNIWPKCLWLKKTNGNKNAIKVQ